MDSYFARLILISFLPKVGAFAMTGATELYDIEAFVAPTTLAEVVFTFICYFITMFLRLSFSPEIDLFFIVIEPAVAFGFSFLERLR